VARLVISRALGPTNATTVVAEVAPTHLRSFHGWCGRRRGTTRHRTANVAVAGNVTPSHGSFQRMYRWVVSLISRELLDGLLLGIGHNVTLLGTFWRDGDRRVMHLDLLCHVLSEVVVAITTVLVLRELLGLVLHVVQSTTTCAWPLGRYRGGHRHRRRDQRSPDLQGVLSIMENPRHHAGVTWRRDIRRQDDLLPCTDNSVHQQGGQGWHFPRQWEHLPAIALATQLQAELVRSDDAQAQRRTTEPVGRERQTISHCDLCVCAHRARNPLPQTISTTHLVHMTVCLALNTA